jgi:hypothetical protein
VTDQGGLWYEEAFTISVTDVNEAPAVSLSINDVTVTEGNSGTVNATFTVTLSAASDQVVTVDFATANGTAISPSDYAGTIGMLTFAPGETTKTITVVIYGDTIDELNETFFVNLSNATNATIARSQGVGTIEDDDPTISVQSHVFYNQNAAAEKNFTLSGTGQRSMIRQVEVVFDGVISVPTGAVTDNRFRWQDDCHIAIYVGNSGVGFSCRWQLQA